MIEVQNTCTCISIMIFKSFNLKTQGYNPDFLALKWKQLTAEIADACWERDDPGSLSFAPFVVVQKLHKYYTERVRHAVNKHVRHEAGEANDPPPPTIRGPELHFRFLLVITWASLSFSRLVYDHMTVAVLHFVRKQTSDAVVTRSSSFSTHNLRTNEEKQTALFILFSSRLWVYKQRLFKIP